MDFQAFYSSSAGNLYRVSSGEHSLLLECGVPLDKIKQALGYNLDIDACLITHSHLDHARSAKQLLRLGVNIHCSAETAHALNIDIDEHGFRLTESLRMFSSYPFVIMPFSVEHDVPGCLGYLISDGRDKLLFAIDTAYIGPRFKGLTHICIECNWSEKTLSPSLDPYVKRRLLKSHMSLETCKRFLAAQDLSTVKAIHLLHLSDGNSDAELFKREVQSLTGKPVYVAG
jgi:phosphoribosyl 1,2-cyclic phosphodiesterase